MYSTCFSNFSITMGRSNTSIQIPEAQGLTWRDTFFDNETDVIAVFDFDYEKIEKFQNNVGVACLLFPPFFLCSLLCCVPCFFHQQNAWNTYSQHVCVTQDGIKYVRDTRKSGCGLECQDQGKTSKTVPFDKITDCDVTEPAGATCCCITNVLTQFIVDTASVSGRSEGGPIHELALLGLEKPYELKKLAWAMKRAQAQGGRGGSTFKMGVNQSTAPIGSTMNDRGDSVQTNEILVDILNELQKLNWNLTQKNSAQQ
jgi:hypothetical protein